MSLILDGTNGLSDVDGSAATPAIRGSDANTGVFFGTDIVGVSTGGTERVRVDASGNVGIGTSSPGTALGGASGLVINSGANQDNQIRLQNNNTGGTSSDGLLLSIDSLNNGYFYNYENSALIFGTNNTERARIDSSGNLLVGGTTKESVITIPSIQIGATNGNGLLSVRRNTTSLSSQCIFFNPNGNVGSIQTSASSTSYVTSSDYRLKHDIQPMTGALAKVAQLKPVTYKWNADDSQSQGFIAHELQEVVPECVTGEKDAVDADGNPQYQGIDTSFLVATLAAAIQELKGINDAQAQIITALTARVEALEGAQA